MRRDVDLIQTDLRRIAMKSLFIAATAALLSVPAIAQSRPPAQINIDNSRAATLTEMVISDAEGNAVARLARPVASGRKTAVRLTRPKGCDFIVQAKFDDEGEVEETVNLCREKVLRFTE
jgi:hypothetical protein